MLGQGMPCPNYPISTALFQLLHFGMPCPNKKGLLRL